MKRGKSRWIYLFFCESNDLLVMAVVVPATGAFVMPAAGATVVAMMRTGNIRLEMKSTRQVILHPVIHIAGNPAKKLDTSLS